MRKGEKASVKYASYVVIILRYLHVLLLLISKTERRSEERKTTINTEIMT